MRTLNTSDIVINPDDRPGAYGANSKSAYGASSKSAYGASSKSASSPSSKSAGSARARGKASPKRTKQIRRLFMGPILTPVQKFSAIGVATVGVVVGCMVVWHSGWPQRTVRGVYEGALAVSADAGFRVSDISVSGRDRTEISAILGALGTERNAPILGVDLGDAKARLEEIPTVQSATVERRLPDALRVILSERRPVALWQHDGAFMLVDKDGHPFPGSIDGYQHLPMIVGEGAPVASTELFALLDKQPEIASRVKAAIRVSNRRWNLRLDDASHGLEARLPENGMEAAIKQLADLEKNRSLTSRHVEMVDLRMSDRMVVKTAPEQTATSPTTHREGG